MPKTVEIGSNLQCPSCGEPVMRRDVKCLVCGALLDPGGGSGPEDGTSRLSDGELGRKLHTRRVMRVVVRILLVPLIIAAFISMVAALSEGEALYWVLTVIAGAGAVYCLLYNIGSKYFVKRLISVNVVQDALDEVFQECQYRYDFYMSSSDVNEAQLITGWTEHSGSDLVQGKYRERGIEFSDIKLEKVVYRTDSNDNEHKVRSETMFRGQWLVYELGRELPASVRVIEKAGRMGLTSTLKRATEKSKDDVETENAAFNAQFRIKAEDPHTAFYILTPHFIEYIMVADAAAGARTCLCFKGSRVHIALDNNRDLFEIGALRSTKDIAALRARVKSEIRYLTGFLDALLQNKYLFGEEN